jgi:hypothetical protein
MKMYIGSADPESQFCRNEITFDEDLYKIVLVGGKNVSSVNEYLDEMIFVC